MSEAISDRFKPIRFRNMSDFTEAVDCCRNNKPIPRDKMLFEEDSEYKNAHWEMTFNLVNAVFHKRVE